MDAVDFETLTVSLADRSVKEISRVNRLRLKDKEFSLAELKEFEAIYRTFERKIPFDQVKSLRSIIPFVYREEEKIRLYEKFVAYDHFQRRSFINFWVKGGYNDKFTYDEKLIMLDHYLTLNEEQAEHYLVLFDEPIDEAEIDAIFNKKRRR